MRSRITAAAAATLTVAGLVATAHGAAQAAVPPWAPTGQAVGTITFYNSSGTVITNGSTDTAPFAAYAVGSVQPVAGNNEAALYFANPDPNSPAYNWYTELVGSFQTDPLTTGPSDVKSASSTKPVVANGSSDQTPDGFESDSDISTASGYQHTIDVRIVTAKGSKVTNTAYDEAALLIDPATHTWTQVYPNPGSTTTDTTSISISAPKSVGYDKSAKITGTLSDTTTSGPVSGEPVVLAERTSSSSSWKTIATVTSGSDGSLSRSVKLTRGEQFQWQHAASTTYAASTSAAKSVGVTPRLSAKASPSTIKHGKTIKIYGTVKPTSSKAKVYLQQLVGTKWKTLKVSATVTKQKLPNGKKTTGFVLSEKIAKKGTYHFRAYKKSASGLLSAHSGSIKVKAT